MACENVDLNCVAQDRCDWTGHLKTVRNLWVQ